MAAAKSLMKSHNPSYKFDAITINKDHTAVSHVDRNKPPSYIIRLGNCAGDELNSTGKKSPHYGSHKMKNKWLKFDERCGVI